MEQVFGGEPCQQAVRHAVGRTQVIVKALSLIHILVRRFFMVLSGGFLNGAQSIPMW